jgi:hypothetical protein
MAVEQYVLDAPLIAGQISALGTSLNLNNAALIAAIVAAFGPGYVPDTIGAVNSAGASNLGTLNSLLVDLMAKLDTLNTTLAQSTLAQSQAIGQLNGTMTNQLITSQIALGDQIKNNQFQQTTTNTSRQAAGLTAIEVPSQKLTDRITETLRETSSLQLSVGATGLVTTAATNAISNGVTYANNLLQSSAVGPYYTPFVASIKSGATAIFGASQTANQTLVTAQQTANKALNPRDTSVQATPTTE